MEHARLTAEYNGVQRERLAAPSPDELAAIRKLAQDLPALWHAATATQEERQTIVRLMLERVLAEVIDASEQVRVECHWHGGHRSSHQRRRPVARLAALSSYADLLARATELHGVGYDFAAIAATLNREDWHPAKRRNTFTVHMIRHLLIRAGVTQPKFRRRQPEIERKPDEWIIRELAEQFGMPQPTLYTWVKQGRLRTRTVPTTTTRPTLVHADDATIAALKVVRATPPPWRRRPPRLTQTNNSLIESRESPCLVDIDLPTAYVKPRDRQSRQLEVVGEEAETLVVFLVVKTDVAQILRIVVG
jgi:hypothetical protein